jgi:hypothetical protein
MKLFFLCVPALLLLGAPTMEAGMNQSVPESVYEGELVRYPGPWAFQIPRAHIILVSDRELVTLAEDPDALLNLSLGHKARESSLRQICETAQSRGQRTLIIAFDHFFSQYRPGQDEPRELTPDMDEYVEKIAAIGKFAEGYGLGLELSLLSPLEIGPAYSEKTGESGRWVHYRKGLRDPDTGAYSVQLWRQKKWANNKGVIEIEDAGVRVFAFREQAVWGTPYRVVDPDDIIEISDTAKVEVFDNIRTGTGQRIRVHGEGKTDVGPLDRVLVVQQYRTSEMDYFSENALPYLKELLDKYIDAGVKLNAFYSDEMHIQQDWGYFSHHDHGQFAMRYVSDGLARRFADLYGEQYRDFDRYLVYFAYGQEDFSNDVDAAERVQHVFSETPEAVHETALFRSRYYRLLQDGVVDLFLAARRYAEERTGHLIHTRAHATWAESPTIDRWRERRENGNARKYEYTPDFVWSNTVHQAAAACHDYFKWGEYLTGTGNDHPEGGWLDRDYYGLALACSTGIINEIPYSYCAHWGHPREVSERRNAVRSVYGTDGWPHFLLLEEMQHRDVDVLMLYPLDLVSVEERFGSWMTQYGYANLITQDKLLEMGDVQDGAIELGGRRFTTITTQFEPFPSENLLNMMQEMAKGGGRVIWSGPPPLLSREGKPVLQRWEDLFGVEYTPRVDFGAAAPGRRIEFEGPFAGVEPQIILSDFLVDRIYPVTPRNEIDVVARSGKHVIGAYRSLRGGGSLTFLGYRPRDDQSGSLGYETRNWFEVLCALEAYPPTGTFPDINDNTEYLSRTTDYLFCRFPNGTVAVAPHLKDLEENWPGGFAREPEEDEEIVARLDLPSDRIHLEEFRVNGHSVTFDGRKGMAFRLDDENRLIAFAGAHTDGIAIDGKRWDLDAFEFGLLAWGPVPEERRVEGGAVMMLMANGAGTLRIPAGHLPENLRLVAEGPTPGSRGEAVAFTREGEDLIVEIEGKVSGRWIYLVLE